MIKKIAAIISLFFSFVSTTYGYDELLENNNYNENNRRKIYLKASVGAGLLNDEKDSASSLKMRSKAVPFLAVGVGTYFMDNTRVDLTFEHTANPHLKKNSTDTLNNFIKTNIGKAVINSRLTQVDGILSTDSLVSLGFNNAEVPLVQKILNTAFNNLRASSDAKNIKDFITQASIDITTQGGGTTAMGNNNAQAIFKRLNTLQNSLNTQDLYYLLTQDLNTISVSTKVDHKASINNFMVNGYIDLFEFNRVKFFAGAGIGGVQLKEKVSITSSLNLNGKDSLIIDQTSTTKKANNFAYSLTAGGSIKVTKVVTFEGAYNFKDYGRTKSLKVQGIEIGKTPYRSHTITGGIRIDI